MGAVCTASELATYCKSNIHIMNRKIVIISLLMFFLSTLLSAQQGQPEPVSQEWVQYLNNRALTTNDDSLGGIPSPTKYYFLDEPTLNNKTQRAFAATYDLRTAGPGGTSLLNPVRNQGSCGSCWTFGAYGCLESWLKKSGVGVFDFSENNMKECHGFTWGACDGGNLDMVTAYLARRSGPVLESHDPYVNGISGCTEGLNEQFFITDVCFLPNNRDTLKQAIIDYGALYTTLNMQTSGTYYNSSDYTYYYNGNTPYNHIVMLVGWDDNKVTSGGTGAWICQNSWGTAWGENGFFYVSYNDTKINTSVGCFKRKKNVSNDLFTLYQIDELGAVGGYGYGDSVCYGAVKYVSENNFDIKSVSTYAKSSNTKIEISIFDNFQNGTFSGLLASFPLQICTHPGYYTFDLTTPIIIPQGNDFYVCVKYIAPGTTYPAPVEMYYSGYANPYLNQTTWLSHNGNPNTWNHIVSCDLAVKVFAQANVSALATTVESPSCNQLNDGRITLQTWGGQPPYSYSWNTIPAQNTESVTNLGAGQYSCTITDALNHSTAYSFTLQEPDPIIVQTIAHTNNPCFGDETGYLEIFAGNLSVTEQYANSVISVTSSMSVLPASNLTGPPDANSWSSNYSMNRQYLVLAYTPAQAISGVNVYEKGGSGSIDSIFTRNAATGIWQNVYAGIPYFIENDSTFHVAFPLTTYEVDAVKLSSIGTFFPFYPMIDAVGICIPEHCDYVWSSGATTPAISNLEAGDYIVTVTNDDGCQTQSTFIITQPDSLYVQAMNDTTICSGTSVPLTAVTSGTLLWYEAGSSTPLSSMNVSPTISKDFYVKSETSCGIVWDTVSVTVLETPYIQSLNDTIICSGSSITLAATGSGITDWYLLGNSQPLTQLTFVPDTTESYVVFAENGICGQLSDTILVEVLNSPQPAHNLTGDTLVCQGESSLVYDLPAIDYAAAYNWTLPAGATGTSSANSISINYGLAAVSGYVHVYAINSCGSGSPDSLWVEVFSKPATPVISLNSHTLHSSAPVGNQWYIQNMSIIGANAQDYEAVTDGDYYTIVTLNGCSSENSNVITTNFAGIEQISDSDYLFLFPNPAETEINIEHKGFHGDIVFEILNTQGEVVFRGTINQATTVQLSSFAQGLYLLRLQTGENIKFMKTGSR